MSKATVTLKHLYHQDEHQIGLYFGYNTTLIEAVKGLDRCLAHTSPEDTGSYTHMSESNFKNFKNPIDDFDI